MIWSHFGMQTTVSAPSAAGFIGEGATGASAAATGRGAGVGLGGVAIATDVAGCGTVAARGAGGARGFGVAAAGAVVAAVMLVAGVGSATVIAAGAVKAAVVVVVIDGVGGNAEDCPATTTLNAARALLNGPDALPAGDPARSAAWSGDEAPEPTGFGVGPAPVDDTMANTALAMSSAIEHDSVATTHIGGRRL